MALLRWRLWLVVLTGVVVSMIIAVVLVNPRLTRYVESQAFREELDKQTSKGLHFQGRYKAIQRTGFLTARTEGFTGNDGVKAIKTMTTGEIDAKFTEIPVDPWIPETWARLFRGVASGDVVWNGRDMTLETSSGRGAFRIEGGRVAGAPFLDEAAALTGRKSIEEVKLNRCSLEFEWQYPRVTIKQIEIEAEGAFYIRGTVLVDKGSLSGSVQFGATRKYLEWLPRAEEIFARERNGYLWTTVNLAGSLQKPQEDLSPRVAQLLKKSPGAAIGIFIRRMGEWFEDTLGGK